MGDELIGSPRLAVFELVKNAYDADATVVTVRLDIGSPAEGCISVIDDGEGMTIDVLRDIWLVPGDDHRIKDRRALHRSRRNRLPLGEKGLGRFAVHKLGNQIRLVTRAKHSDECVVEIDWNKLITEPFLSDAPVTIAVRRPQMFTGKKTGTLIEIRQLRQITWNRGEVRRLQRQIVSICSPFEEPEGFKAVVEVPGHEDWITDIPDVAEILKRAIWTFSFELKGGNFTWNYHFRKVPALKLQGRSLTGRAERLLLPPRSGDDRMEKKVVADNTTTTGIGPISGQFYIYDRDREVLRRLADTQLITNYLDENGGIRIYRDGIRVYNYGEPGDDWLGLDLRRVNAPTRRISRNIIIGAVHLSLAESDALTEKTNREGFVENDACERLKLIVLGALAKLESERQIDKENIRKVTASPSDPELAKIRKPLEELRRALDRQGLRNKFEPYLEKIEYDYKDMQSTLLQAGMSGLNLAVVFHEVERGVRALHSAIVQGSEAQAAADQARDLMKLLDGFSTLLRRDSRTKHTALKLVDAARRFNMLRLRHHVVRLTCPLIDQGDPGFEAVFSFSLVLGALNNLIDNALYWMRVRWPEVPAKTEATPRRLFIDVSSDLEAGPAIVIADTGPGFQDDPERLVRPFFTRKPNGMGLGLYYANLAMELNGGQLLFPDRSDLDVPQEFDGALLALVFGESK